MLEPTTSPWLTTTVPYGRQTLFTTFGVRLLSHKAWENSGTIKNCIILRNYCRSILSQRGKYQSSPYHFGNLSWATACTRSYLQRRFNDGKIPGHQVLEETKSALQARHDYSTNSCSSCDTTLKNLLIAQSHRNGAGCMGSCRDTSQSKGQFFMDTCTKFQQILQKVVFTQLQNQNTSNQSRLKWPPHFQEFGSLLTHYALTS